MKKKLKIILGFLVLATTAILFVHYLVTHPELVRTLQRTNPLLLIGLLFLYAIWLLAQVLQLRISLRMLKKTMPRQENFLLNAYSSLLNFFGPGQSGPGLRALYLKKRHDVRIKDFIFTTLIYYAFYAMLSAFLLFVGSRPWWQTLLLILIVGGGSFALVAWYKKRSSVKQNEGFSARSLIWLFLATAVQLTAQVAIYWVELRGTDPSITFSQVLTYTGAANFALFVALTPGAIGIRESFLFFTGSLHHISNATIIAANVIDRAAYIAFLGILFVVVMSLHAKDKLRLQQLKQE